jgi:hypothetical protein
MNLGRTGGPPLREAARPAQAFIREGTPDSLPLRNAMGRSADAQAHFARSIELAATPEAGPRQRAMPAAFARPFARKKPGA